MICQYYYFIGSIALIAVALIEVALVAVALVAVESRLTRLFFVSMQYGSR